MTAPILALKNINKSFGPIDVLHDINLEVRPGEVLCLLGDNGAGKSTLIKILSAFRPHPPFNFVADDPSTAGLTAPSPLWPSCGE